MCGMLGEVMLAGTKRRVEEAQARAAEELDEAV